MGNSGDVNVAAKKFNPTGCTYGRIDRTESKLEQIEHKIISAGSSSNSSSESSKKKSISPVVRVSLHVHEQKMLLNCTERKEKGQESFVKMSYKRNGKGEWINVVSSMT